ncbi:DEAD/DEAH box helicase [Bifidobacterium imperatoris]|uniref:DEAD/DEAH box helicase n=2 Tax=Bifidobacterium imperatoris TaxID=2020965 RepID=A0A2N5IQE2_9BIFI|nr:DEAD/DEAH box helicase [Bifidobacterium imperatoris]
MPYTDFEDNADTFMNGDEETRPMAFGELGVPGPIVRELARDDKKTAFPIQADTLPDSLSGRDILGRGRTGSGKTLAFSIPLVARLGEYDSLGELAMEEFRREIKRRKQEKLEERRADDFLPHPRGLVLAPTRELANQINDVIAPLAHVYGIGTTTVYGGVNQNRQVRDLRQGADIVVACPGRLEDLLRQKHLTLSSVEVVVIDEADEMADMGFLPPVKRLLEQVRPDAQHMLFSATLDHGVDTVVEEFLKDPKVHSVDEANAEPDLMTHHVFETTRTDKHELVRTLASGVGQRILFTRTKFQTKKLAKNLTQNGIPAAELHGNLNQNQRDRNLAAFESGDVHVMVATDVAARGIDVSGVELVVQVEPPEDPKAFLHRSGRTARAGRAGDVVTIVLPEQRRQTRRMLREAGITVKPVEVTHESPEVLELVGERAPIVNDWNLDKSQPVGGKRRGGKQETPRLSKEEREARARQLEQERNARKKDRRRRRAAERLEAAEQAKRDMERQARDAKSSKPRKPNRAERRAGLSDREAERRDYLFEHPEERRHSGGNHRKDYRQEAGKRGDWRNDTRRGADARNRRRDDDRAGSNGGKRIHRRNENRIIVDERGEAAKRHERRMQAKYGNTEGSQQRHTKHFGKQSKTRRTPFRMQGTRSGRR